MVTAVVWAVEFGWGMTMITLGAFLVQAGVITLDRYWLAGMVVTEAAIVAMATMLFTILRGFQRARVAVEEIRE